MLSVSTAACASIAGLGDLVFEGAGGAGASAEGGAASGGGGAAGAGGDGGGLACPAGYGDCDGMASNGCEEALAGNDGHCGGCNHACAPTSCAGTRCDNAVLLTGEGTPFGIRAAGGSVFWVASDTGAIRRCDLPDCAANVRTIANSGTSAFFLSIDASHVFWNRNGADQMWRCPLDGCLGSEELLASNVSSPTTSTVSGGYLYWAANEGTVRRIAVDGGTPELLAMPLGADGWVEIDGADMYWTTRSAGIVRRCTIAQCQTTAIDFATGLPNVVGLDVDATHVYVSTYSGTGDVVYAIPKSGGAPNPLALGLSMVWTVIELGDYVYWVEDDGNVARGVPKAGGNIVELVTGLQDPWVLTSDGEFIFVADTTGGRILRIDPL